MMLAMMMARWMMMFSVGEMDVRGTDEMLARVVYLQL